MNAPAVSIVAKLNALADDERDVALRDLPGLLADVGRWSDLRALISSLGFIELKLRRFGLDALIEDVERYAVHASEEEAAEFHALAGAMRVAGPALRESPEQLAVQLAGRLMRPRPKALHGLVNEAIAAGGLRPLYASLAQGTAGDADVLDSGEPIEAAEVTPDARRFITLTKSGRVSIWSLPLRADSRLLTLSCPEATALCVSPDGARLITATKGGVLVAWEMTTGFELQRATIECGYPAQITFGAAETLLLLDRDSLIVIDASTLQPLRSIDLQVPSCLLPLSSGQVLVGSVDGVVEAIDLQDGRELGVVGWHGAYKTTRMSSMELFVRMMMRNPMYGVSGMEVLSKIEPERALDEIPHLTAAQKEQMRRSLKKDPIRDQVRFLARDIDGGRFVASAGGNGEVALIDLEERRVVRRFRGHADAVSCCALSSSRRRVVSGSYDRSVRLWDMDTGTQLDALRVAGAAVTAVAFTDDARQVLMALDDGQLRVLRDLEGTSESRPAGREERVAAIEAIGRRVFTVTSTKVAVWDSRTQSRLATRPYRSDWGVLVGLTPDHRRAISAVGTRLVIWDIATGWPIRIVETPARQIGSGNAGDGKLVEVVASSDLSRMITYAYANLIPVTVANESVLVLRDGEGAQVCVLDGRAGHVRQLLVSADGRWAATLGERAMPERRRQTEVRVWDMRNGTCVWQAAADVSCMAFDPGSEQLWWRIGSALQKRPVAADGLAETVGVVSSPWSKMAISSGRVLAVSEVNTIELWDLLPWQKTGSVTFDAPITAIGFAGTKVIAGDASGGVHFLEAVAGEPSRSRAGADDAAGEAPEVLRRSDAPILEQLDAATAFADTGRAPEALEIWRQLGRSQKAGAELRSSVARHLSAIGEHADASELWLAIVADAKLPASTRLAAAGEIRPEHLETALATVAPEFARTFRGGTDERLDSGLLSAVLERMIASGATASLRAALTDAGIPEIARIAVAHALGRVDPLHAAGFLKTVGVSAQTSAGRTLALEGLRHLISLSDWLDVVESALASSRSWLFFRSSLRKKHRAALGRMIAAAARLGEETRLFDRGGSHEWYELGLVCRYTELNNRAMALMAANEMAAAIDLLSAGSRIFPSDSRMYLNRAGALIRVERYQDAIDDATKALKLDTDYDKALNFRAYAFIQLGEYELALEDLDRALQLRPGDLANLTNRAECLRALGRLEEAENEDQEIQRLEQWQGKSTQEVFEGSDRPTGSPGIADVVTEKEVARAVAILRRFDLLKPQAELTRECALRTDLPSWVRTSAFDGLAALGATDQLSMLLDSSDLEPELKVEAAKSLLQETARTAAARGAVRRALQALGNIVTAPDVIPSIRQHAALVVASHAPAQHVERLARAIDDVSADGTDPSPGLMVAMALIKSLGQRGERDRVEGMAANPKLRPWIRQIACETLGVFFDRARARELLRDLAREHALDPTLGDVNARAVQQFEQTSPHEDRPRFEGPPPVVDAFEAFLAAPDNDAVTDLVARLPFTTDPEFIELVEQHMRFHVQGAEREALRAKLDHLKTLPQDAEQAAFRAFARAKSPEEMQAAAVAYPILTIPEYHPKLVRTVERDISEQSQPAFWKRLEWLRALPPDKRQSALQAFAHADTPEKMRAAAESHPLLKSQQFRLILKRVVGEGITEPSADVRLQWLDALGPDPVDVLVDAAYRDLQEDRPADALEKAEKAATLDPDRSLHMLHGQALLQLGEDERAIPELSRGLDEKPTGIGYERRAKAFMGLDRIAEAIADFTRALELDPDLTAALLGRGIAFSRLANWPAAAKDLSQACALDRTDELAAFSLASAYLNMERLAETLEVLDSFGSWSSEYQEQVDPLRAALRQAIIEQDIDDRSSPEVAFHAMARARDSEELSAAVQAHPLLADPQFLRQISEHVRAAPDNMRPGLQERFQDLLRIVSPEQRAFDAMAGAADLESMRRAVDEHPMLRDAAFVRYLEKMCEHVDDRQAADHVRAQLNLLRRIRD
jgi:tetratricopeptide (TPR) repeat protein/WD40 repeat protein